jgi:hypothetical protein
MTMHLVQQRTIDERLPGERRHDFGAAQDVSGRNLAFTARSPDRVFAACGARVGVVGGGKIENVAPVRKQPSPAGADICM